jgi:hypothetical protein
VIIIWATAEVCATWVGLMVVGGVVLRPGDVYPCGVEAESEGFARGTRSLAF